MVEHKVGIVQIREHPDTDNKPSRFEHEFGMVLHQHDSYCRGAFATLQYEHRPDKSLVAMMTGPNAGHLYWFPNEHLFYQ